MMRNRVIKSKVREFFENDRVKMLFVGHRGVTGTKNHRIPDQIF